MVKKNGKQGYRSFTLIAASKAEQCKTKGYGGRFINKTPSGAAKKAFTDLCRTKNIRGVCTLFVVIKETTTGSKSKGRVYSYKIQRQKLAKPIIRLEGTDNEFVIEYLPKIVKSMGSEIPECDKDIKNNKSSKQTRGRQKKRTAKRTFLTANNVRKLHSKKSGQTPTKSSNRLPTKRNAGNNNTVNNAKNNNTVNKVNNLANKGKKSKRVQSPKSVRRSKRIQNKIKKVNNYFW